MTFIKNTAKKILGFFRNIHLRSLRKRLENPNPTIIADTCIAGVMYHNLGLPFTSPTINLWIPNGEYFDFLENLRGFLSAEMSEVFDEKLKHPIGLLTYEGKSVHLYANHYRTFEEFKSKWDERKKRVDFDNLYVIAMMKENTFTREEIERFEALPYENKLMITGKTEIERPFVVHHKHFDKPDYVSGSVVGYKSKISITRHMDDIDYVGFLNGNMKKRK